MKLSKIICLLLSLHLSIQAQVTKKTEEQFFNANANASNKVTDNSVLNFYTTEEFKIGKVIVPRHTRFSTIVNIVDGRAYLRVNAIKIGDEIQTIDWRAVGPDFKEGIPIIESDRSIEVYEDQRLTFKAYTYSN